MKLPENVREWFAKKGAIGGSSRSAAKQRSSRANGKLGGMPRKFPRCPRYGSHRFSPNTGRCPCGYVRAS